MIWQYFRLLQMIGNLQKGRGSREPITVILVSHAMDDILRLADEMFVLQEGRITGSGAPLEVFKRWDVLAEAGLEPPELLMLLEQLQGAGLAADMPVRTLKDAVKAVERGLRHAK